MFSMSRRQRGLCLVELMVVLAVVAGCLAVILPAVLRARGDARRNSCQNNLKQIGLALHNYHDVFNAFPPGWVVKDVEPATGPCFGWGTSLLPFLEEQALYNQLNAAQKIPPLVADERVQKVISQYRCPADPSQDVNPVRDEYGTSNYAGNYGDEPLPGSTPAAKTAHGIFFWNSRVRMKDITDGTSNTFAIGERSIASAAGIWMGVRSNQHASDAVAACNDEARLNAVLASFSSRHDGGAHFAFCDGAVRLISDLVDSQPHGVPPQGTYQKLAHKSDGQPVSGF